MKGIKGILILLIAFNICLLIYMIFFVKPIKEYTYEEYRVMVEGENPELEAALKIRIFPENKEYLEEKYDGNMDLNYLYEKIHELVHTNLEKLISDIKGLNASGVNEYLTKNKENLLAIAGITNVEQLSSFKYNINEKNINEEDYVSSEIIQESYVEGEDYDSVNLKINYKNDSIFLKTKIANNILTSPMIIFESIGGDDK